MPQDYWVENFDAYTNSSTQEEFRGIDEGPDGLLYVAAHSTANYRCFVVVFDQDFNELRRWGDFSDIRGIAVNSKNEVHILDVGSPQRIRVHDTNGNQIRAFGDVGDGLGQFAIETLVRSDYTARRTGFERLCIGMDDLVVALDHDDFEAIAFDNNGSLVRTFGSQGLFDGQFEGRNGSINFVGDIGYAVAYKYLSNSLRISYWSNDFNYTGIDVISQDRSYDYPVVEHTSDHALVLLTTRIRPDNVRFSLLSAGVSSTISGIGSVFGVGMCIVSNDDIIISGTKDLVRFSRTYLARSKPHNSQSLPLPRIISVQQRPNSTLIDIDYQIIDTDSATVETALLIYTPTTESLANAIVPATFVEGTETNLGENISTNVTHRITWDAAADLDIDVGNIQAEVLAQDDRGLYPFHWVTIPGDSEPDLTVSQEAIPSEEFYFLWPWLVATESTDIELVNGQIVGVGGEHDSELLYDGTSTTDAGRAFLLKLLNVQTYSGDVVQPL
ncbi:MAG: hypothetical protein AAFX93_16380 [Verrucomicrobiota bacterium]